MGKRLIDFPKQDPDTGEYFWPFSGNDDFEEIEI